MNSWIQTILVLLISGVVTLKLLAIYSRKKSAAYGIHNGSLAPINHLANSVSSEGEGSNITPLTDCDDDTWKNLTEVIKSQGGKVITSDETYLHAHFRTPILGFEDDFEARFDAPNRTIHLRSSSRVGYSDAGTNRRRVEALKGIVE